QDDEDLAFGIERPHAGALVILLLGEPPVTHGLRWTIAAQARRVVTRRALEPRVAAGRHRAVGLVHARDVRPHDPIGADVEHLLGVPLRLLAPVGWYAHHRGDDRSETCALHQLAAVEHVLQRIAERADVITVMLHLEYDAIVLGARKVDRAVDLGRR